MLSGRRIAFVVAALASALLVALLPASGGVMIATRPATMYGASGALPAGKCWIGSAVSVSGLATFSLASAGFVNAPLSVSLQAFEVVTPIAPAVQQSISVVTLTKTTVTAVVFQNGTPTAGVTVYLTACGT